MIKFLFLLLGAQTDSIPCKNSDIEYVYSKQDTVWRWELYNNKRTYIYYPYIVNPKQCDGRWWVYKKDKKMYEVVVVTVPYRVQKAIKQYEY